MPCAHFVKLREHPGVIIAGRAVNGEHAGRFADAEDVFARQPVVHITGQRRDMRDLRHVRFFIQDGLIQMRHRPALRDIEAKGLREPVRRLAGHGVLPRAERGKQVPVLIKGQIAVHHTGNAHRGNFARQFAEVPERGLQAGLHLVHVICPDAVFKSALPRMIPSLYDLPFAVQQNGLDAGRAELDPEKILRHSSLLTLFAGLIDTF